MGHNYAASVNDRASVMDYPAPLVVVDETGGPPPVLAAADQDDLRAQYKRPLSVGAGGRLELGSLEVYGSVEWFAGVDRYEVLSAMPFDELLSGAPRSYVVEDERESVLNWALATEHRVSDRVTAYASFATDYSSIDEAASYGGFSVAAWDVRQVSLGVNLRIRGRSLALGGAYGWGDSLGQQLVDLQAEADPGDVLVPVEPTPFSYSMFRLILGFRF